MKEQTKLDILELLGYDLLSEFITDHKITDFDIWKEFDPNSMCYNFGLFIYDEEEYPLVHFVCRGGVYTGNKQQFNNLLKLNIPAKFHSWYEDNIFIVLGCIPQKLWIESGVETLFKVGAKDGN
jgi:hypothetical protein